MEEEKKDNFVIGTDKLLFKSFNDMEKFIYLTYLYRTLNKSATTIGRLIGTTQQNIFYWFKKLNIIGKTIHDAKKKNGHINTKGYRIHKIYGKAVKEHRLIYETHYGKIPQGYDIHHIDGNKLNNNIDNLEMIEHGKHTRLHNAERN